MLVPTATMGRAVIEKTPEKIRVFGTRVFVINTVRVRLDHASAIFPIIRANPVALS